MKKQRQANLELLRIIAMVMVVTAHLVNHGNMITMAAPGSVPYYIVWTLFGVSFTCINIYLLISSYFLIDAKFSTFKIARMAGQVFFYAFGSRTLYPPHCPAQGSPGSHGLCQEHDIPSPSSSPKPTS